jgi:hypothetical protein
MLLDLLPEIQHCGSVNVKPPRGVAALEMHVVGEPIAQRQRPDVVTYSACCTIVSIMTKIAWESDLLTCMGCPPTKHSQFQHEVAFSWPLSRARRQHTALPGEER